MDRHVHDADGAILINRIKPHTDFHGRYESGLMKMALIGLGKLEGARAVHDFGIYGLRELIEPGATRVLATERFSRESVLSKTPSIRRSTSKC
jgi:hypothetical protein